MTTYAQVLLIAIPIFMVLMLIECIYGWFIKKQTFRSFDTIASLSSGITNLVKDILGLTLIIVGYNWMYEHIALTHIKATWLIYLISFILIDLAGYLKHYLSHRVNYFWNEHVIHHSSEEFNLACALRQPISNVFSIGAFLLIPAALIGMPPKVIATIAPIHLFLQFWYHTRHIGKLGWLEYLIVTPSQHRVHHAINPIYLDKNMGQIFPWWDRLFGTFQEELEDEPCFYGIKKPAETWNPVLINFQHFWRLAQDAWRTHDWKAKFTIWFKPTGWRPADVTQKYPIHIIDDPREQVKHETNASLAMHIWSWIQLTIGLAFLTMLLIHFESIGFPMLFVYGGFIALHIFAYSMLMDLHSLAPFLELVKCLTGLYWIWDTGDWFGLNEITPQGIYLISAYLLLSLLAVSYFANTETKPSTPPVRPTQIA
ncbi:Sterol desaturase/sphingolipid hydroxylase, fatty acid hydroxylase superfamily [Reichenbachiella agariperforans]|uniref:Sterol desaturase/sphingolipid hydroxylase, fatty acid hydroxylase superfamily n=1 Tax=Reichenbachiella agariperforans TaxID=156994 RepID=A0A1M6N8V6_REIAG|nr:sterol desaturase family protein [Reichenbachiella agariperforans]SHJ92091.1 Sterol desaturase/sphingolipid hydroxylase, fatty acid hydroxylase superfamily [Reichenbachiella agariperforans]